MTRREVIEFYVRYDCGKKGHDVPALESWPWDCADALDATMHEAHLKCGILPGYTVWDLVPLSLDDLRTCAVEKRIFPGNGHVLSLAERAGHIATWQSDRQAVWLEAITRGLPLDPSAAMIIRPAVTSEAPAKWYLEDGSGRAIALLRHAAQFDASETVAFAYVGRTPDHSSTFMRKRFGELLGSGAA
jgi:hypothetical protein